MYVDLRNLQPNPFRDFTIDPINEEMVEELRKSIAEDGFWGGVVCRLHGDDIQIAAGHHRVRAALAAGLRRADLFVSESMDDAAMVRVYARENATQRGNTGTAMAGTVASALRVVAKALLTGDVSTIVETSERGEETLRGQLLSDKGVGEPVLMQFLGNIRGIGTRGVREQLANLKASGDYARIIAEVEAEIAREHQLMLERLAEAEREQARLEQERLEAEERARQAEEERRQAAARAKAAREAGAERRRAEEEQRAELARQRAKAEQELADKRRQELSSWTKIFMHNKISTLIDSCIIKPRHPTTPPNQRE